MWLIGVGPFLLIHLPIALLAASIGVWLFYVQHQFEGTTWAHEPAWSHPEAALHGSSHYDLPLVLRWLTANIGVHHVHHLNSRIPYYRLGEALQRPSRTVGRRPAHPVAEPALRPPGAVGRKRQAADLVRRVARAGEGASQPANAPRKRRPSPQPLSRKRARGFPFSRLREKVARSAG